MDWNRYTTEKMYLSGESSLSQIYREDIGKGRQAGRQAAHNKKTAGTKSLSMMRVLDIILVR